MLRVGVDVGGTFTDIFVYDETTGETVSAKVPTTPENQAIGVMRSVDAANVQLGDVGFIAHGTTTGTNALIERKGARTALLSTDGFSDILPPLSWGQTHDRRSLSFPREGAFVTFTTVPRLLDGPGIASASAARSLA